MRRTGWRPCRTYHVRRRDDSLQADVSPVKVFEYMAFGLAVVAFDLRETRALSGQRGHAGRAGSFRAPRLNVIPAAGPGDRPPPWDRAVRDGVSRS